jgi:Flp pilus assembly pilin Flp
MMRAKSGQSVLEYALLLSVLCAVFLTMFVYLKNAVWSRAYVTQQRINEATR